MDNRIDCSLMEWLRISENLFISYGEFIDYIDTAWKSCEQLKDIFDREGIDFEYDLNLDTLEEWNTDREKLIYMANGIFYEMSELVDVPFALRISDLLEKAVEINPTDITLADFNMAGVKEVVSLSNVFSQCIVDEELKTEFNDRCLRLNDDIVSFKSENANIEAEFWAKEYEKAELCSVAANKIFTEEIREGWYELDDESKLKLVNRYKTEVAIILSEGNPIYGISVEFIEADMGVYGHSQGDRIELNNDFIDDPHLLYDVDKLIDNITHEMRHQYQGWVSSAPDMYGATEGIADDFNIDNYKDSGEVKVYSEYYTQEMEIDSKGFAALTGIN